MTTEANETEETTDEANQIEPVVMPWKSMESCPREISKSYLLSNGEKVWEDWTEDWPEQGIIWVMNDNWADHKDAVKWCEMPEA